MFEPEYEVDEQVLAEPEVQQEDWHLSKTWFVQLKVMLSKGLALVIQSWTDTAHHNWPVAQLPFSACGVRVCDAPPPNLWRRVSRCCAAFGMAAATAARSRSATEVWLLGQARTEPCWGKQLPKNGQVLRRFFHFVRVQRKSVKEAASLVTAEVAVVWEKARIPTQKKSRCVERILRLYASWQNLDRSKKRSAEVDVENRRSFSLALMTLFDIGHADAFDLITVDEDRQFLLGQALPGWNPVASCKESTNPWPTESDGVWSAAC
ncbi:hypothetical protein GWK47_008769 [Chionoecetes opilio]|uniref:Uncharacterized protein n=1 Tax=Chionoecetes opilio TaxID=41210 RepID=A0A8J4XY36_CHIOP|nr:hypothetical protein GWK47_008769 [Chionoecetes opilio]